MNDLDKQEFKDFDVKLDPEIIEARLKRSFKLSEQLTYTFLALIKTQPATVTDVWFKAMEFSRINMSRSSIFRNLIALKCLGVIDRRSLIDSLNSNSDEIDKQIKEKSKKILSNLTGQWKKNFGVAYFYFCLPNSDKFLEWIKQIYPEIIF